MKPRTSRFKKVDSFRDAVRQYAVFLAHRLTGPSLGSCLCPRLGRESISPRHVSTLPIWSVVQNSL